MIRAAFLAAIVLFATKANAVFSAFAYVTPETQEQYGFEVCLDRGSLDTESVNVSVRSERPMKGGWLITTFRYVEPEGQEFRRFIWDETAEDSPIESIAELRYDEESGTPIVSVPRDTLLRSYLYFDFPQPVFDGGYYFSIDLSTFAGFESDEC